MISPEDFTELVNAFSDRMAALEIRETIPTTKCLVAELPAATASQVGRLRFVSNGRKVGEGVGAGTGTLAYCDGVAWRRVGDDTTVAA